MKCLDLLTISINLYSIAYRLEKAKKPETRDRWIQKIIEMLVKGEKFH